MTALAFVVCNCLVLAVCEKADIAFVCPLNGRRRSDRDLRVADDASANVIRDITERSLLYGAGHSILLPSSARTSIQPYRPETSKT